MSAKRSYAARRRGKRRKQQKRTRFWLVTLLTLIAAVGIYFGIGLLNGNKTTSNQASQTSESTVSSTTTTTSSSETTTDAEEIIWEEQTEPVQIPILMYHAIHVMAEEEAANANLIVDPATFESHLQALQDAGYYTLSPAEAYKILTENVLPQGKKVVWLTFDDSLADFYSQAYPILTKYQMKATNNVITGFVENNTAGYLTVDQMLEMKENGMSFESHTVSHPDLEYSTSDAQIYEMQTSKEFLDANLSQETTIITYPSGRYNAETGSIAESLGYKLGLTTNEGLASAADGLFTLNRVRILPTTTADSLLATIATE